jgi:WD40 repeat protein
LETGMHTAQIHGIAVDAAEHFLVSASLDKTARVWDLATGKLLQTLRPPLDDGHEGMLYAVAISPDGNTIAVGGWTGYEWSNSHAVYLFDRASGKLTRRLPGLPNTINKLAYSPDARYLAVGVFSGGVRIYRTADWQEVLLDEDCDSISRSVAFDPTGRLLTACSDGLLRLYDAGFHLIAKKAAPGGKEPYSAHLSPDGSQVAVGFDDTAAVNVLSGKTLEFLFAPQTQAVGKGDLAKVVWSPDGRFLYAGGDYKDAKGWPVVLRWDEAGRGKPQSVLLSGYASDLRPLTDGRLAYATNHNALGLLNVNESKAWHTKIWEKRGEVLEPWDNTWRVSADGTTVEFRFYALGAYGQQKPSKARFDVSRKSLLLDPPSSDGLVGPNTLGEATANWADTLYPKVHGQPIPLRDGEISRHLALAPQGKGFLLATDWYLRYYDSPHEQRWQTATPSAAWAVNLSPDGRYAVAALDDGTIRWFETQAGHEALALYVHPDGKRWVAWTPEGFYAAAPGAEQWVGFHLNRGADQAGLFVAGAPLAKVFSRPDLVARRLSPEGGKQVKEAWVSSLTEVFKQIMLSSAEPEKPETGQTIPAPPLDLRTPQPPKVALAGLEAKDTLGGHKSSADSDAGVGKASRIDSAAKSDGRRPGSPGGSDAVLPGASAKKAADNPVSESPPRLFMLAVGIHDYRDKSLNQGVAYADRDAHEVAERFRIQGQRLYQSVNVRELRDSEATGAAIREAMAEFARQANDNDVFVLYLAGHGFAANGKYHFVPWDDVKTSEADFRQKSLDQQTLVDGLVHIKTRKTLVLVDSCATASLSWSRSGGDAKDAIAQWAKLSGKAIIAATNSEDNPAREGQDHGYFTLALLEGLKGEADRGKLNGTIEVDELADYIEEQLPKISAEGGAAEQFPWKTVQGASFTVLPKP